MKKTSDVLHRSHARVKVDLRKRAKHDIHFVRACDLEMHMDISQGNFCASARRHPAARTSTLKEPGPYTPTVKTRQCGHCLGMFGECTPFKLLVFVWRLFG